MGKKKDMKLKTSRRWLWAVVAALLTVMGYLVVSGDQLGTSSQAQVKPMATPLALIKTPLPTPTPTPTPKPTPTFIPVPIGKSIRVPILMYHYIGNNPNPADKARDVLSTTPDKFQEQMDYLEKNGFTPITLDTLYADLKSGTQPSGKPIVLTFDDGYIDFYVNAFPILRSHNFHAVSFIPTSLISQGYYMSWGQIKEIQSSGLIAFEAHSLTHPNLAVLSFAEVKRQVNESKKILEGQIGVPVNFFAYPYGTSNQSTWEAVKEAGFYGAVGTWYGNIESEGTQYNWPRIRISGGLSIGDFAAKVR